MDQTKSMENHDRQTTLTSYAFYCTKKPLIGSTINGLLSYHNIHYKLLYQNFTDSARGFHLSIILKWKANKKPLITDMING
ncbi:hypothetical protein ACH0B6_19095 [Solibacillus silvestris]